MMRVLTVHIISLNFPVGTLDVCKVFHICALISLFLSLVLIVYFFFFLVDLLGLLKWRSNTNLLQQNLRQLMKVDGGEVVKVCVCHF